MERLQPPRRFFLRNWPTILHGDISVKWSSVYIKHIKNIFYFCKGKDFMFEVPISEHIQVYCF